ncbi:MAG: hypothetical protein H6579_04005 [Chitinophagales bacterium]|nr:hypothetical protein [Chitinophagales bacterium]
MKYTLVLSFLALSLLACSKNKDINSTCDLASISSIAQYNNAPSDLVSIDSIWIEDNCLHLIFGASGCSGDSWEVKLIDSEAILESYPPQRNLRLSLKNDELCLAYFTKELSFDISNLQVDGDRVYLNLSDSNQGVLYEY